MFVWFRVLCLSHRPSVIIIDSPRMRCCCAMTGTMHDKLAKQKKIILKINSWFYWSPVPACTVDAWKKKPRHHQKNSPVRTQNKTNGLESRSSLNVGPAGAKRKLAHVAKAKWTVSLQWIWLAHDWHASCQRNRPDKTRNLATNNNIDMG